MRRILIKWVKWMSIAGAVAAAYFLYNHNLGAIPFLILSLYFFRKAKQMMSPPKDETDVKNRMKNER